MSEKPLVVVESPTKAKTIAKFLGKQYSIIASNGHIRDLPNSASEIPASKKKEKWSRLGVNVEDNFSPLYVVPKSKKDQVKKIKEMLKQANILYLATDEDREGESISWHLREILKPKVEVKRLVFHEITKSAIDKSLKNARQINEDLVRAQETRRIVDRLFGYEISPLLWKKMSPGLSAGRVQSVAVRLLVDRERERIRFRQASFYSLKGDFSKVSQPASNFEAEIYSYDSKRIAIGRDFDAATGQLKEGSDVFSLDEAKANELLQEISKEQAEVEKIEQKPYTSSPAAPFVTSSLQQESNRKFRYSAKHTMIIAQKLYENGFITYMRTDSTTLSGQALDASRQIIKRDYGDEYLPPKPRVYTTKVKNAQEAHEAIRPAGESFATFKDVESQLGAEAAKIYELIWKRTIGSQMTDSRGKRTSLVVKKGKARFRASGKTIEFPGYLKAYVEGSDDPSAELLDKEKLLPQLSTSEQLDSLKIELLSRHTQAPARYTEGTVIKELENRGIGRPSTWATIVELVLNRSYAFKKSNALVPTFTAMAVVGLLEKHFDNLLDYKFTARLEDDLDAISRGEAQSSNYLKNFYFGNGHPGLRSLVTKGEESIDPREVCAISIGKINDESEIEVRIGRYGPFLSDGERRCSVPEMLTPEELTIDKANEILSAAGNSDEALGLHPDTQEPIYLKSGRFGPYVQLGEKNSKEDKPKMSSLLSNMNPQDVDLQTAIKLLSLPRNLGKHPEMGDDIIVSNGRYGPYVKCAKETRSINIEETSPLDMSLEQAIYLLSQEKKSSRRAGASSVVKELGKHPVTDKNLVIKKGRYGPYVTDGKINASLPKGQAPEELTMDEAVNLIEQRIAKLAEK